MRVITHSAETVRELRQTLGLTQREFAQLLGVSRRTIVRGEQRGLEVPWYSSGSIDRYELSRLWNLAEQQASDLRQSGDRQNVTSGRRHSLRAPGGRFTPAGSDTLRGSPPKVSPRKGAR
jgi:ribosome-binding protein aMBF1 (putative translation factor)